MLISINKNQALIGIILDYLKTQGYKERELQVFELCLNGTAQGKVNIMNSSLVNKLLNKVPFIVWNSRNVQLNEIHLPNEIRVNQIYLQHVNGINETHLPIANEISLQVNKLQKAVVKTSHLPTSVNDLQVNEKAFTEKVNKIKTAYQVLSEAEVNKIENNFNGNVNEIKKELHTFTEKANSEITALNEMYKKEFHLLQNAERAKFAEKVNELKIAFTKEKEAAVIATAKRHTETINTLNVTIRENAIRLQNLAQKLNETQNNINTLESNNNALNQEISDLKAKLQIYLDKETNIIKRQKWAQKLNIGFIIGGLIAISIFAISNMVILGNAVAKMVESLVLSVFIEALLWGNNISMYVGKDPNKPKTGVQKAITGFTLLYRCFANVVGSYYTAKIATEKAAQSGIDTSFFDRYTDIDKLYFGFEVGNGGLIATAIGIAIFMTIIEWLALPYAIKELNKQFFTE